MLRSRSVSNVDEIECKLDSPECVAESVIDDRDVLRGIDIDK